MTELVEGDICLKVEVFSQVNAEIGKTAGEILAAGPKLGLILRETAVDLYQTFRIEL